MNKTNTPTPEGAGAATSSVTKLQCKDSENQRPTQSDELKSLMTLVDNPTEPEIDKSFIGVLCVKEANEWCEEAAQRPDPKQLWMSLWYEGECACLFADSNLGKSIYAVQIANEIAKNEPVLYCDFELSDKAFQLRYSDDTTGSLYKFPANFKRAEIDPEAMGESVMGADYEDIVVQDIESAAVAHSVKVIIIDNLSWICNASEKGDAAGRLMQNLVRLKKKHGWSLLIIAHTPKRPLTSPIDQNTLAGSKKLINFFDSAFAIGRSAKDENLRYVKQIKIRNGSFEYGADNVIVADISKENGFLKFNHIGYAKEREHLKEVSDKDETEIDSRVMELHRQGKKQREISQEVGVSLGKVNKIIKSQNK